MDANKYPQTPNEWQEAVNLAEGALMFKSSRDYGLVTGGPEINVVRCDFILAEGRKRGIHPAVNAAELFLADVTGNKLGR